MWSLLLGPEAMAAGHELPLSCPSTLWCQHKTLHAGGLQLVVHSVLARRRGSARAAAPCRRGCQVWSRFVLSLSVASLLGTMHRARALWQPLG